MSKTIRLLVIIVGTTFLTWGCTEQDLAPDVDHINPVYVFNRFDRDLAMLDTTRLASEITDLKAKHGDFWDFYFDRILPLRAEDSIQFQQSLKGFLTAEGTRVILDTIDYLYGDMADIKADIDKAFQYYQYYFPQDTLPDIYTVISDFGFQRFLMRVNEKDAIGIGLDMFLGEDFPYKNLDPTNPSFSDYLTRRFAKPYIVKKAVELLIDEKVGEPSGDRLLDHMIDNGKKLYLLDKVLPFVSDEVLLEYTESQTEWVADNMNEMWAFFFKEELFYKTSLIEINKYINEAPHSPGMPPAAPGRTANYLGWQIVKAYMDRYPETTIDQLLAIKNGQEILNKSKFKPER